MAHFSSSGPRTWLGRIWLCEHSYQMKLGDDGHLMGAILMTENPIRFPDDKHLFEVPDESFDLAVATALDELGTFVPAITDGKPVTTWLTFLVHFGLNQCTWQKPKQPTRYIHRLGEE